MPKSARWRFLALAALTPQPTPPCYPLPQATGEKFIGATLEAPPPTQVAPAQTITIVFSGGYVFANYAMVCGEKNIVGYVHSDELPGFSWDRAVQVRLDEKPIASFDCGYTCRAEVTIPADTPPGAHTLGLRAGWERVDFDIAVAAP